MPSDLTLQTFVKLKCLISHLDVTLSDSIQLL